MGKKSKHAKKAKSDKKSKRHVQPHDDEQLPMAGPSDGETTPQDGADAAGEAGPPAKMKRKDYEREMALLQGELVAMQEWVKATGAKVCIVFEGLDSAGKGGTIRRITERTSPRVFKHIALPAPSEREKSQMYVQRYMAHFPSAGEVAIFDRSWYNRAGVEPVMGYCTQDEADRFLRMTPLVEKAMVDNGIILIKYWLNVSVHEQTRRLRNRIEDPRKIWKLSPTDLKSYSRHFAYCKARDAMLAATDSEWAPWFVADNDDKKRGRLNIISHLLSQIPYEPMPDQDIKMPRKPSPRGYQEPDLPVRHVPSQF